MKYKKIGLCKILKRINDNAYEVSLPKNLNISPMFNVADFYKFHGTVLEVVDEQEVEWQHHLPNKKPYTIPKIHDKQSTSIRQGQYNRYLVQWDGLPDIENTWLSEWVVMQLDPSKLHDFTNSHLQQQCFFQEGENDAGSLESHNF